MNHKVLKNLCLQILAAFLLLLTITACTPAEPTKSPTETPTEAPILPPEPSPTEVATFELPASTLMSWWDGGSIVYVPGGGFVMGDPKATEGDNIPAHPVRVNSFWIHRTEVTNRMYAQCVAAGVCQPPIPDPNYPNYYPNAEYANHPVANVTWQDSVDYCTWIGGRLPSEAEWEWVARGDTGDPYPWGEQEPNCSRLDFLGCTPLGTSVQVGSYLLGLSPIKAADMAGNVFEWVNDRYSEDYYAVSPAENPSGPQSGDFRVVRSSSFLSKAEFVPVTLRFNQDPEVGRADLGFRCILSGEAVNNPPEPVCTTLSYEPIPRQPPSIQIPAYKPPAFSVDTYCRLEGNGNQVSSAVITFETGTDVANLEIASPQGTIGCIQDVNPLLFTCIGSALKPGNPLTIKACNTLLETVPLTPQTCPCKIEGLTAAMEGTHIRVKWNQASQACSDKIFLRLQCDGAVNYNVSLPGSQTELVIDACPLPYTNQRVCVSCIDPDGNPSESACSDLPYLPPPTCPVFYKFNSLTKLCEYQPMMLVQCSAPDVAIPGYGCLPAPQSGNCPVGYYDASYKNQPVCIPSGGPLCQGPTCPATCPAGLVFNESLFCCEYPQNIPPVCPVEYVFDPDQDACVPAFQIPAGCTSVTAMVPVCKPEQPGPTGCLIMSPTGGQSCVSPCPVGVGNKGPCTP